MTLRIIRWCAVQRLCRERTCGTQGAACDMDVFGIFVVSSAAYARLIQPPKQVFDERNGRTYDSLVRFCELMAAATPTPLETLLLPEDCILKTSPAYFMFVANQDRCCR